MREMSRAKEQAADKRIHYIDILEAISIFLVVWCHHDSLLWGSGILETCSRVLSATVAVPLFFLANGALFLNKKNFDLKKHVSKVLHLFIAVLMWRLLIFCIMWLTNDNYYPGLRIADFIKYLFGANLTDADNYTPVEQFWFMYALIGIYVLFPLFKTAFDQNMKIIKGYILLAFILVFLYTDVISFFSYVIQNQDIKDILYKLRTLLYPFGEGGEYIAFFLMGGMLHKKFYLEKHPLKKKKIWLVLSAVSSFLLLTVQHYIENGTIIMYHGLYLQYQRTGTFLLSVSIFILAASSVSRIPEWINNFFAFLSKRTMNIFAIHMLVCVAVNKLILDRIPVRGFCIYFIRTVVVVALSLIITEPFIYIPVVRDLFGIRIRHKRDSKVKAG